jgi:hypothetical protein
MACSTRQREIHPAPNSHSWRGPRTTPGLTKRPGLQIQTRPPPVNAARDHKIKHPRETRGKRKRCKQIKAGTLNKRSPLDRPQKMPRHHRTHHDPRDGAEQRSQNDSGRKNQQRRQYKNRRPETKSFTVPPNDIRQHEQDRSSSHNRRSPNRRADIRFSHRIRHALLLCRRGCSSRRAPLPPAENQKQHSEIKQPITNRASSKDNQDDCAKVGKVFHESWRQEADKRAYEQRSGN